MEVLEAKEIARLEKLAFDEGASSDAFMRNAAQGIAQVVDHYIQSHRLEKKVTFVAGKGNNGGDAFCAALFLVEKGFEVSGYYLEDFSLCSPLCKKYGEAFFQTGSPLQKLDEVSQLELPKKGLFVDGILGTGFEGEPTVFLKKLFHHLNQLEIPIFAIDIPSGLNGNTGEVHEIAIHATHTLFLGCPKKGFFIREGWNYVGELIHVDFGLDTKYLKQAKADFEFLQSSDIDSLFPKIVRNRHKYQAGYVVGISGSKGMMGASILSGMAALRSGAGIVKVIHLQEEFKESSANPELIHVTFQYDQIEEVLDLLNKASAVYLGPGMGVSLETKKFISKILIRIEKPCVLDADVLTIIAEEKLALPKKAILTPHMGEMHRLLGEKFKDPVDLINLCQKYVDQHDVILVLKGGPSFIFMKGKIPCVSPTGDPGMATAGSGDVLTGMLVGFLAQEGVTLESAALLGVYLHGKVGEIVAKKKSSYGLIASDLIKFLYKIFPKKRKF